MKSCPNCKMVMRMNYFGYRNKPEGMREQSWCKVCRWNKWNHTNFYREWQKDKNGRLIMKVIKA